MKELKANNLRTISYNNNPLTIEEKIRLDSLELKDTIKRNKVDSDVQTWLNTKYPLDKRNKVEKLNISYLDLQEELNLEGFINLKNLDCSDNKLIDLDLNKFKKLKYLDYLNNQLWKLDVSSNKELQEVHVNHNEIWETNFTGLSNLHTLMLTANQLEEIDLSGLTNLLHINITLNSLKSLDLKKNLKLKHLYCYKNSNIIKLEVNI